MKELFRKVMDIFSPKEPFPDLPPDDPLLKAYHITNAPVVDHAALYHEAERVVERFSTDQTYARDGAIGLGIIAETLAQKDAYQNRAMTLAAVALKNTAEKDKRITAKVLTDILETMPLTARRTEMAEFVANQINPLEVTLKKPSKMMWRLVTLIHEDAVAPDSAPGKQYMLFVYLAKYASNPVQIKEAADGLLKYSKHAPSHEVRIGVLGAFLKKVDRQSGLFHVVHRALDHAIIASRPHKILSDMMLKGRHP